METVEIYCQWWGSDLDYADIYVPVTQDHIDRGERKSPNQCPIALAFKDCGFYGVAVNEGVLDFRLSNGEVAWTLWRTEGHDCAFVRDFDEGRKVSPFTYHIIFPLLVRNVCMEGETYVV